MKDSVHSMLVDLIRANPAYSLFYTIQRDKIYGNNETQFTFSGIKNAVNIKSFHDANIAWVEEAQTLSQKSIQILIPTIRAKKSEIWFSYNPLLYDDPMHKFMLDPREDIKGYKYGKKTVLINYLDNPFCPEIMTEEANHDKETDLDIYNHVWLGYPLQISEAVIFKGKYKVIEHIDILTLNGIEYLHEKPIKYLYGMDFGFSQDPFACIQFFEFQGDLYITNEIYECFLENDDIQVRIEKIMPDAIRSPIYADNSQPNTISQLRNNRYHNNGRRLQGMDVRPAIKGAGSIIEGIKFIQSYNTVFILSKCKKTIYEFGSYKYKENAKTGEIMPEPVDKNNHAIDAIRYGLNPLIIGRRGQGVGVVLSAHAQAYKNYKNRKALHRSIMGLYN